MINLKHIDLFVSDIPRGHDISLRLFKTLETETIDLRI